MFNARSNYLAIFLIFISCMAVLTGCTVAGSPNRPVEDDSVTLLATVDAPEVLASGILAAIGQENNNAGFARFVASASCKVNGNKVEFSLNEQTRQLQVEKLPPAAAYDVELLCGKLTLKGIVAHSGRRATLPKGLSLRSTADWKLRDALARLESLTIDQLSGFEVKQPLIDTVAAAMQTELKRSGSSADAFTQLVTNSVATALSSKSFTDCLQKSGSAISYNGEYTGSVYYFSLNKHGQPELAVQAVASMTCSQSGNTVSGNFSLTPTGVIPLVEVVSVSAPGKTAFTFFGKVSGSMISFVRKGDNNGSPLSGKDLDSWFIFPVSNGFAVRASNLDKNYHSGIQSRAGEFVLQRK